jgi:hypothetical protein
MMCCMKYKPEYPYQDRISNEEILNCKDVFSANGAIIGQVEAALAETFQPHDVYTLCEE